MMKKITATDSQDLSLNKAATLKVTQGYVDLFVKATTQESPLIALGRFESGDWVLSFEGVESHDLKLFLKLSSKAELISHDTLDEALKEKSLSNKDITRYFDTLGAPPKDTQTPDWSALFLAFIEQLPTKFAHRQDAFSKKLDNLNDDIDSAESSTEQLLHSATRYHQTLMSVDAQSRKNALTAGLSLAALHIGIKKPLLFDYKQGFKFQSDELEYIAQTNNLNVRRINLSTDWPQTSQATLIGFDKKTQQAVLLIPRFKGYDLIDPLTMKKIKINLKNADSIEQQAYVIYPSFENSAVSFKQFRRLILKNSGLSAGLVITCFILIALLSLISPIITSYVVNVAIPNAEIGFIYEMLIVLLSVSVSIGLFTYLKEILIINVELRANIQAQAAVFDRLLKQPVQFFARFNTGDLANRTLSVDAIIKLLTSVNINGLLGFAFSIFSLALMFYYQWLLTVMVLIITSCLILLFYLIAIFQLKYIQKGSDELGDSFGFVFQALSGISKIKLSAKQVFATERWARVFAHYRNHMYRTYYLGSWRTNLFQLAQISALFLFFAIIHWHYNGQINLGHYMAFNAAFLQFYFGLLSFSISATNTLPSFVFYRRLKPILEQTPEENSQFDKGFQLKGHLNIAHLSFRYAANAPMILNDLSLDVPTGQFIALVGYSGAGKSSLLKCLMGFESPVSGSITYDGREINTLNIKALRRQLGVVLQDGALMPGSILENIIGQSTQLDEQDAWEAARLAAIDKDIAAMPMGMHTVVAEGMGTISGGQKQRILIARALVRKPKILFLDEATSALDNKTQAIVSKNIEQARITRLVIAHRLSTIQHADVICVLKDGQIIERGSYQELLEQKGFFYELAESQIP